MKLKIGNQEFESNSIQCDADETFQTIQLTIGKLGLEVNLSEAECIIKMLSQWTKVFNEQNQKLQKERQQGWHNF